eukprot:196032-Hanusia_phi.AAC.1
MQARAARREAGLTLGRWQSFVLLARRCRSSERLALHNAMQSAARLRSRTFQRWAETAVYAKSL